MATLGEDSRVQLYGENQHDDCGYCGGGPVVSYGIRVQKMTTSHYQGLMDRGWRRSGTYFYKPTMHQTCCPQYTIRLECSRFQMSKSQRAVLKTMARYLHHGSTKAQSQTNATRKRSKSQERKEELPEEHQQDIDRLQASVLAAARGYLDSLQPAVSVDDAVLSRSKVIYNRGGVHGDYSSNIAIVLASHFKRESQMEVSPTEVADAITSRLRGEPFEMLSQRGFLNFTSKDKQPSSEAKDASDSAVVDESRHSHKRKLSQPSGDSAAAVVVAERQPSENQGHVLTIETTPAVSTPERFELYSKYQQAVHDDKPEEVTNQGFTRFLANSPLYDASKPGENPNISSIVRVQSDGHSIELVPCDASGNVDQTAEETLVPEGSYHQLYRLDGKLIAIGVVDVTANTLSSVYCIYDPDYRELMLGKFCALMEIQWVTRHTPRLPQMRYYYMGYYIHSCQKMRYKGEYRPSELLCPQSFSWQPLADCIPIFERYRFSPLRPDLAEARARIPEDTGPRSTKPPQESSTSSSDDASASVEQENGDKNDGDQTTQQSPLDAFAPEVANKEEIAQSLRLDIGAGFLLTLQQLMPDSQVYLLPILAKWVEQCGATLAPQITLVFTR